MYVCESISVTECNITRLVQHWPLSLAPAAPSPPGRACGITRAALRGGGSYF